MNVFSRLTFAAGIAAVSLAVAAHAEPTVVQTTKVAPGGLYEIVFNPADSDVYVAATGSQGNPAALARLDGQSLAPEAPIDVTANPLFGLGLNSKTQVLYGTATRAGVVAAIDLKTGRQVGTIKHGEGAHLREVIVDEAANRAYASVFGSPARDDRPGSPNEIWVIDGSDQSLDRVITVDTTGLTGIAHDAAGNRIFGTGQGANEVVVVDLATDRTVAKWPTGTEAPINLAYDAAGKRLFVVSGGSGDLAVINATDGSVIRRVPTGEGALSVAFNPAVNQVYVANRQAGTVTVVDSNTYAVLANLTAGTLPQTIAIDRASNTVYVTNKARGRPRGAPADTPVPADPGGDTVTIIRP